jgi:hypothetical protein
MAKADIAAGKAFVSLYIKGTAFTKGLAKAKKELNEFGSGIMKIGAAVSGMGAAITGSLTGAILHFAAVGDALDKMSLRTGVSATALAELGFAAEQSGANIEAVESALQRMQRNLGGIGPESIKTTAALEALGLSMADVRGLSPEDQFQLIAERIGDINDPAQRAAAAMAVFGQGGRQLLPMLESIRELRQEARDLGIAPDQESVAAAAQITDAINRVRRVIGAAIFEIGASIAPMVADVLAGFLQGVSAVRKFVVENRNLVVIAAKVGAVLLAVGSAIVAVGAGFIGAGLAIGGVLAVISAFSAAAGLASSIIAAIGSTLGLLLTPVGLLVVALAAGAIAWARFTQSGQTAVRTLVTSVTTLFGELRKTVGDTFAGIVEAIRAGDLALAGQIAMVGLRLVIAQGLEAIHGLFGETIGTLVGQILGGDLSGAWSTLGSTMLASWAQVANGIVSIFASVQSTLVSQWRKTVDAITNDILAQAGEGGIFGKAFEAISGVNVKEEMERAKRLEQQRRDRGLAPQDDDIASQIAAGTYQDPGIAAIEERMQGIIKAATDLSQEMTEAAQMAVDNAVEGQSEAASANVAALVAQLAELRREAQQRIEAGKQGRAEEEQRKGSDQQSQPSMGGRASVATNSLAALAQIAGPQQRMERLAQQQIKKQDEQIAAVEEVAVEIRNLGLFHA